MGFQVFSSAFADGGWIPDLHTCSGADISPAIEWSGAPTDTRSFALLVEDPDAPAGVWCHWLLYDLGGQIRALPQGYKPGSLGISGSNDFGKPGYGGPCPPKGHAPHRYFFRLSALKGPDARASSRREPRGTASGAEGAGARRGSVHGAISEKMIYTCYEMVRDCRENRAEGWRYFIRNYVPVAA